MSSRKTRRHVAFPLVALLTAVTMYVSGQAREPSLDRSSDALTPHGAGEDASKASADATVEVVPPGTSVQTFYSDATIARHGGRGGIAASSLLDGAETIVYETIWASGITYSQYHNFQPSGAFLAAPMTLSDEYIPGGKLIGFDTTVYRSGLDPGGLVELADIQLELWDGDPLGMIDTPGGGYLGSPIPGTFATFSGIPTDTVAVLEARFSAPVPFSNSTNRVWMVLRSNACRLGWVHSFVLPTVGSNGGIDSWLRNLDFNGATNGAGTCCFDGSACDVDGPAGPCESDLAGNRGHCSDGVADEPSWVGFGAPCTTDIYTSSCSNFVATVYTEPLTAVAMVPIGNGPNGALNPGVSIRGDTIVLPQGGTTVLVEARGTNWDLFGQGDLLMAFAVRMDGASFTSGIVGTLTAAEIPCTTDADCAAAIGGACSISGNLCTVDADCPFPQFGDACEGHKCITATNTCWPLAINTRRGDFIFRSTSPLPAVDMSTINYRWSCALSPGAPLVAAPDPFPDEGLYMGGLMLDVPVDAKGTFEIGLFPNTAMVRSDTSHPPMMGVRSAKIIVNVGSCCYTDAGSLRCIDDVSAEQCAALPGSPVFSFGATCAAGCGDCNNNGIDDVDDIAGGSSFDCNNNVIPDECEADCNDNGIADECELFDGTANDCNDTGVPDECETDCNGNGFADECDLADGTSLDCNANDIPDDCEADCDGNGIPNDCDLTNGTSVDLDGNDVPDECECPPASPLAEAVVAPKNRYLSVIPGNRGQRTALRVTCVDLPAPYDALNGAAYWVGQPRDVSIFGGQTGPTPPPTIKVARLTCVPYFTDWDEVGTVHIYHENTIPGGSYTIEAIDEGCDLGDPAQLSPPLVITTALWGDVAGAFVDGAWEGPDGSVDVTDALAIIDAYVAAPWSPGKARADLDKPLPDQRIGVTDIVASLDAFGGAPFPYPPTAEACP